MCIRGTPLATVLLKQRHAVMMAVEYAGQVKVGKLDVDSNPRVAQRFNIRAIPTILYFKDGEHVDTVVGVASKAALEAKIQQHA